MKATHFIEVYKHNNGFISKTNVVGIEYLKDQLKMSEKVKAITIAIFKITPKH